MPAIKKILFPVDFSPRSIGAARYVESFAGWYQAQVKLLHVVDTGTYLYPTEAQPCLKTRIDDFLRAEFEYFPTERDCVLGDPAEKIAETARAWKPDLIMLPTRGLGVYRRLLLGSVAAKVLDDTQCPVWTSVHAEFAPPLEKIQYRKILCALDLGERSGEILKWAADFTEDHGAELGIVHATPVLPAGPEHFVDQEFEQALASTAHTQIDQLQERSGTHAKVFVMGADPSAAAACAAKEFRADLMIIGRHNGSGIAGHLRRNAYSILRESPCPVMSL